MEKVEQHLVSLDLWKYPLIQRGLLPFYLVDSLVQVCVKNEKFNENFMRSFGILTLRNIKSLKSF